MRSLPLAAASFSRSTNTGVRLCLPALMASERPHGGLDREAHDGLVDRADLFDVECTIGQPLARAALHLQCHQAFEDAQQATVGDGGDARRMQPTSALPFEEWKCVGIEQLAAARLHEMARVALVDQPEQRQAAGPSRRAARPWCRD